MANICIESSKKFKMTLERPEAPLENEEFKFVFQFFLDSIVDRMHVLITCDSVFLTGSNVISLFTKYLKA